MSYENKEQDSHFVECFEEKEMCRNAETAKYIKYITLLQFCLKQI